MGEGLALARVGLNRASAAGEGSTRGEGRPRALSPRSQREAAMLG